MASSVKLAQYVHDYICLETLGRWWHQHLEDSTAVNDCQVCAIMSMCIHCVGHCTTACKHLGCHCFCLLKPSSSKLVKINVKAALPPCFTITTVTSTVLQAR